MNSQVLLDDIQSFVEHFELSGNLRGKTFLITGATGLIGSILTKCLLALNLKYNLEIKLLCPVRSAKKSKQVFQAQYDESIFIQGDLLEYLRNLKVKSNYIIHCASPTASKYFIEHPVETYTTAIDSTRVLLEYMRVYGGESMVYVSSLESYGAILDDAEIVKEDAQGYINPLEVRSSYSMGKRATECMCYLYASEFGVPVKIARLTQTFGAGVSSEDNRVFAQFARSVVENNNVIIHTTGESAKPYCYTIDCISAILYILLCGKRGEAYNVANESTYISIKDMAELLIDRFNPKIKLIYEPHENMGYAPITKLRLSTLKLKSLGWRPQYNLCQMFDRYIKSIITNKSL